MHDPRLSDRLAAARRSRFVGREAELTLFRSALQTDEPPFAVLHIHGPSGVGKTTLLRQFESVAAEHGRCIVRLDARNIEPSPPGFLHALHEAIGAATGRQIDAPSAHIPDWPVNAVLMLDTYERLAPLDAWLRETFLPQLPARSLVVIAGRNVPASAWRTDIDWADLTRIVSLRNLRPDESKTYLTVRGVPDDQHVSVLAVTHGHPLALSLVADVLNQNRELAALDSRHAVDMVRVLLERFVQNAPDAQHRRALEVCAVAWATTESLLADVLRVEDAHDLFEWLRGLSFIEQGLHGLFPHDLAREVLEVDLRWRNPDSFRQLRQRIADHLRARVTKARGLEGQRILLDWLYAGRDSPFVRPFFDWTAMDVAYAQPAQPDDASDIVDMVRKHEGTASAHIAEHWLRRQLHAFLVFRNIEGERVGFVANIALHEATPDDLAADPAASAALEFAKRYGPPREDEEIYYLRLWMGRDTYQAITFAINLTCVNTILLWMARPNLAWSFIAMADPEFWTPHFSEVNIPRSPEADFEVGGRRYGVFAHDWRIEPMSTWLTGQPIVPMTFSQPEQAKLSSPVLVLSQPEFEDAVRHALRNYTRPDMLAGNPLLRSRLALEAAEQETTGARATPVTLQALLRDAAATLIGNPKDEKLHRAVWHTYFEPAATQERAAELLDLPFNTYRYHLSKGIERITAWLWQRELHGVAR
ncbi:MAG: ATP-binding protein [Anaerolineae bacterium]|nr:ATP-binding protein [Anaerolineae bacterium]